MSRSHLPLGWHEMTVEDIAVPGKGAVVSGPFGSNIGKKFFVELGVPVIRGNNLTIGKDKFIDDGFVYITEQKAYELRNCEAISRDIIFTAAGTLGQVGIIPDNTRFPRYIISNKQLRLRVDTKIAFPLFVYYWFINPTMTQYIINQNTGASIPLITLGALKRFPIRIPSLSLQQRIAAILSAYDDLIENNQKRIRLLEQAARDLYQEWFVHFRFPGHEQVEMVDSGTEYGMIPQGWEVSTVKALSSYINRGISPHYDDRAECVVINQKCIRDARLNLDLVRRNTKSVPSEKYVRFGDVLINSTGEGTLGRVAQVYQEVPNCTVDSHVSIVRPGTNSLIDYLGLALIAMQEHLALMGEGATNQTELGRSRIAGLNLLLPPDELLESFTEIVVPLRHNTIVLMKINSNLRQTRDLLLPRLVSGELDVSNLDIPVSEELTDETYGAQ